MAETLFQYQQVSQVIGEMHKIVIFLLLVNIIFICYSFAMLDLCLLTARVLTQTLPIGKFVFHAGILSLKHGGTG